MPKRGLTTGMTPEHSGELKRMQEFQTLAYEQYGYPALQYPSQSSGSGSTLDYSYNHELQPLVDPVIAHQPNLYSPSDMDVMGMLIAVRQRPTPTYNLGNVDTHVALVICDGTLPDTPIIYATENFEKLTGYRMQEVVGRNCRLLQEPPSYLGVTVPDAYREYNKRIKYDIRYRINHRQESQAKIVNYKKTGEPFMNVLTIIPITYPDPQAGNSEPSKRYIVGFQARVQFDI